MMRITRKLLPKLDYFRNHTTGQQPLSTEEASKARAYLADIVTALGSWVTITAQNVGSSKTDIFDIIIPDKEGTVEEGSFNGEAMRVVLFKTTKLCFLHVYLSKWKGKL